jgi:hypothetical protein
MDLIELVGLLGFLLGLALFLLLAVAWHWHDAAYDRDYYRSRATALERSRDEAWATIGRVEAALKGEEDCE